MEGRKQASWRQSTKVSAEPGEDERVLGERAERHPEEAPSRSPHRPGRVQGRIRSPHFRLVSGTHFLFHLSDSIMPPCNFRLGLLCLPSPHFSLWPQSSFFLANKMWSAGRVDCIKGKDLPLRSNIYSYCHASLFIFINLIYYNIMLHKCMHI